MSFGVRALIRLGALDHNLQIIRRRVPDAKVMAVIKANAYGHGMLRVARHLRDVDSFAVARSSEARVLRESGITKPIVVFAGVSSDRELLNASQQGFEIVVHCAEQIELLAAAHCAPVTVWLKIDTGMNRLGFRPGEATELIARLQEIPVVGELRLMTHLASADDTQNPMTHEQLARFRPIVSGFSGSVSIANSPATFAWPEFEKAPREFGISGDHWIRTGIALFGISPFAGRTGADLGLRPVMRFEAHLIATKPLQKGDQVGYGGRYTSEQDSVLGIVAAGYGDGYSRHFRDGTPVSINGRRVPLIGNVSMDMIAVDLGADASDEVGDVALLWGDELPLEEVAPWADAIPYELACGITKRRTPS